MITKYKINFNQYHDAIKKDRGIMAPSTQAFKNKKKYNRKPKHKLTY